MDIGRAMSPEEPGLCALGASGFLAPIFRTSRRGGNFACQLPGGPERSTVCLFQASRIWDARNPDAPNNGNGNQVGPEESA